MTHTAKHTPGPWFYNYDDHCIVNQAGVSVVNVRGAMGGNDTNADTALIAAAPAMYEALKMARWLSNECECHESWNAPEGNLCGHCTADLAIKTALSQAEGK